MQEFFFFLNADQFFFVLVKFALSTNGLLNVFVVVVVVIVVKML